jgi:lysophospholipase L1-like esterase
MTTTAFYSHFLMLAFCSGLCACTSSTDIRNGDFTSSTTGTTPAPRTINYDWMSVTQWQEQFAEDQRIARTEAVDILWLGDSITAGWNTASWEQELAPLHSANFGIGGDHTGNLLWRIQQLDAEQLHPKLIVLQIGVNNFGHLQESPDQVYQGVLAVVKTLKKRWPTTKILLNAVFPFEQSASSPRRHDVRVLNNKLKSIGDEKQVYFRGYGHLLLNKNGSISTAIMADYLHPTPQGYSIWKNAMLPDIRYILSL